MPREWRYNHHPAFAVLALPILWVVMLVPTLLLAAPGKGPRLTLTRGEVRYAASVAELKASLEAANRSKAATTLLLADGTYLLDAPALDIQCPGLVIRSANGNRDAVIVRGPDEGPHAAVANVLLVSANDVVIADLTFGYCCYHGIQVRGESPFDVSGLRVDNCRIVNYPGRVPLLGEYNSQETVDREILAAARHGIDFFLILWYYNGPGDSAQRETHSRFLNEGLRTFIRSPEAHRLGFAIEYCNHPPYEVKTDRDWEECTWAWLPAFRHPSYLRVGGKLLFKVHSWHSFWRENGENADACRARLDALRRSVREAGLGEMLIGAGVAANERIEPGHPAVQFFEFTNTYMDLPNRPARDTDEPYDDLARFIRESRNQHAQDAVPYCPFLGAGFNARPWPDTRARFAFPTRDQWTLELRHLLADLDRISTLGLPLPGGRRQKVFTIYAWNEFGEGGIVAPTRGEGTMKLEAIRDVFGRSPR